MLRMPIILVPVMGKQLVYKRKLQLVTLPRLMLAGAHDVQVNVAHVVHVHAYESGHVGVDVDGDEDDGVSSINLTNAAATVATVLLGRTSAPDCTMK